MPVPSAAKVICRAEKHKLCPKTKEGHTKLIELAIGLLRHHEINMEVKRGERAICAQTDLFAESYFGAAKNWINTLTYMASEYSILLKDSEYATLSLDYTLYDRYDNNMGKKVDW